MARSHHSDNSSGVASSSPGEIAGGEGRQIGPSALPAVPLLGVVRQADRDPWVLVIESAERWMPLEGWLRGQNMRALDLVRKAFEEADTRETLKATAESLSPLIRHYMDPADRPEATRLYTERYQSLNG